LPPYLLVEDRNPPALLVLLMLEVLVGNDHQVQPVGFRAIEQFAVTDPLPVYLDGGRYLMTAKRVANLKRNRLVEENPHATLHARSVPDRAAEHYGNVPAYGPGRACL
jgi:hypothetical protein